MTNADLINIDGVLEASGPAIALAGTSSAIAVAPKKDFGAEVMGMSSYRSFTLTNSGTADLSVNMLSKTGDDFLILNDRCSNVTLAPLKVCTFQVVFIPQSEGAKTGSVAIPSNDPDVSLFTISLTGSGAAPTGNSGTAAVPYGDNVVATPTTEVTLAFDSVTSGQGQVTATAVTTLASPAPSNFRMLNGASYDITTTASFSGPVTVCINYDPAAVSNPANEQNMKLFHFNGSAWQDITTSVDTVAKRVCGVTTSLSPFAVAEEDTYTITASAGANGAISPAGAVTVLGGTNVTFTMTPAPGYRVQTVLVDGASVNTGSIYNFTNVTAGHTISVTFEPDVFTLTAAAYAGGSITPAGDTVVARGGSQTYTITPDPGYAVQSVVFDSTNLGAVTSYAVSNVTANHTITARFTAITYAVTASAGTGGSITSSGALTVPAGGNASFTIAPSPGYSITDVLVDGVSTGPVTSYTFTNVTVAHTISASFAANPTYTITASAGSNGSISPSGSVSVAGGASQSFTMTPAAGYRVQSVLVDGASVNTGSVYNFTNVTADHTISVTFEPDVFTLSATAYLGGSISPAGDTVVAKGGSQTYTITPDPGYAVQSVVLDSTSLGAVTSYTVTNVTANHTIRVSFMQITYAITASTGIGGSISPAGISTYIQGADRTYTITPAAGYHIADVLVDGTSVGAVSSYMFSNITANHTISASFTANPTYTITASAGSNGSISPSGGVSVTGGTSQTFTMTPAAGYRVQSVLVDGVSVGPSSTYNFTNVTANHTISVSFEPNGYTITATANAGGSITPAGDTIVAKGGSQTYTITPDPGYVVRYVVLDGFTNLGAVTSYTITNVKTNHTIKAYFKVAP